MKRIIILMFSFEFSVSEETRWTEESLYKALRKNMMITWNVLINRKKGILYVYEKERNRLRKREF